LGELVAKGNELAEAFRKAMPPFYEFGVSVASGNVVNGLMFVLWAIVPFAAALTLLAVNYKKILTTNKGSIKIVYHEKQVKSKSVLFALFSKERAKYWSRPNVIMNSSFGSVFMLILPITLLPQIGIMAQLEAVSTVFNVSVIAMFTLILTFLGSANGLSASLISLEGKNLWIVKSIPVSSQTILRSKILTHLFSSSIPCLFASVCIGAALAKGFAEWILLLIVPQTIIALISVVGLVLNLHFPKLDWTNEIYVVKQSASAMITQLGGMALLAGLGFLYLKVFGTVVSATVYLWICGGFFCLAGICAYAWLMNKGAKMFAEL
jgi:ABC-2 type transport system permease protein